MNLQYISFILERTFSIVNHFMLYKKFRNRTGILSERKRNDMFYEIKFNAQCSRAIDFFDVNGGKQFQEKFKMFCINPDKILPILEICSRHISLRLF